MKYLTIFLFFFTTSVNAQRPSIGHITRLTDFERDAEKKVDIAEDLETGKTGFDTHFKFTFGFANEQKAYFFRLIDAKADLEKGCYHAALFGDVGKYFPGKELGITFQEPVVERLTITGIWQYKDKEYKGVRMTNRVFLQPPAKFSNNDFLYGVFKLTDIKFYTWEITDKNKLIGLIESRTKK